MGQPIERVTIVGGGTAGWLTAILLKRMLAGGSGTGPLKSVTLIESPNIPTVGVGEATVPGMPRTLRTAGVSEKAFFSACNASFKLGVRFVDWNTEKAGTPISYVNPFARAPGIRGVDTGVYYLRYGAGPLDYTQTFSSGVDMAKACKGPRPLGAREFQPGVGTNFAYHLDAGRFAELMKDICIEGGITHVLDDVLDVELDERGYVAALQLERGGRHPVEMVIDCSGFRGLVINKALGEPFVSYARYLANDRAMALQIPHPDPERIEPMTRATALGAGWSWRVPLFNRIGTGYVYSSAHRSDDEAREEYLRLLGPEHADAEPRVIPMRVGRNRNAWVKNCVAIGLSGGFIEPLESTAIHMIDTGVRWLVTLWPDTDFPDPLRNRYNKLTGQLYDEVRDFICAHYVLGNRTDTPYWIDAREALEVPDSLAENIELWRHGLPGPYDLDFESLFTPWVYHAVLLGKRVYETGFGADTISAASVTSKSLWLEHLKKTRAAVTKAVAEAAPHKALLRELRGEDPHAGARPPGAPPLFALAQPTVSMPGTPPPAVPPRTTEDDSETASLL